ncbi:glyoxylase-like metal-dependent hydrolase (beta-lactamase superfamily II) [Friedmanniella endophytica]|uniref:Glyoxylase-like metal-dependent hydrolase (Beta-lactamase superfamily II) n=1 Tax=Microlunatus kandeliicorticis TaxID=1759536 RepID=A0A7W3P6J4_9ACTN|nr:MBL fold metallo-hydrolase [Microlunatus kandeliicorticis]MBA8795043.1 glyoxylase-like metal-dependent hydrolase (beta-lactamase superfamily II) [Microlunatus kandeliicorticis]
MSSSDIPGPLRRSRIRLDVAPGVHALTHAATNCYLLADEDGVTLVDACFASSWPLVERALELTGHTPGDLRALVLTHGHFDHVGFAASLVARRWLPVWVHPGDRRLARHPYRYRPECNRLAFPLRRPRSWPVLAAMVAAGALRTTGVTADHDLVDGAELPVPGRPRVLHLPGHTDGQCALLLPDRSVLVSGDALVTLDPYTGRTGPRLVAPAATAVVATARASVARLADVGADLLLPGHGDPWPHGVAAAASAALRSPIG